MSCLAICIPPSPSNAHCAAEGCHQTFGTVTAFDRHRRDGACLDPAGLRMHRDGRGIWRWDTTGDGPSARRGIATADENGPGVPQATPDTIDAVIPLDSRRIS